MFFVDNFTHIKKLQSYHEAKKDKNWAKPMKEELDAPDVSHTWELTYYGKKKVIGSMWIYKFTLNSDGTFDRYEARSWRKGTIKLY